ncbi:MAG: hypothetical protein ACOYON_03895 [Fimbriimonas sp.]
MRSERGPNPGVYALVAVGGLWISAGLEDALAPPLAIYGVSPDFLLIFLACLSPIGSRMQGASVGFAAGALQGALAGANLMHYAISRSVTGLLAAWSSEMRLQANPLLGLFTTMLVTVIARLLFLFLAPSPNLLGYLGATIGSATYNGVLAVPLYWLLNRIFDSPRRESWNR